MKIINFLVLAMCLVINGLHAQEFSFKLAFSDAVGNRDTLILGYDLNATDSIDSDFDEINIISNELDTTFEVRVSNEWKSRSYYGKASGDYHLKRQIVKRNCETWTEPIAIDIKCKNWPVTATWDSLLFDNTCRFASVFTSLNEGMWWDVSSPSNLYVFSLKHSQIVSFTSNGNDQFYDNNASLTSYINTQNDTISVFWLVFGNPLGVGTRMVNFESEITAFPNPTTGLVYFKDIKYDQKSKILIYDQTGKLIYEISNSNFFNLSNNRDGLYYYQLFDDKGIISIGKIIKNSN